jgi:F-type H+-transporting ATPase subunit delta
MHPEEIARGPLPKEPASVATSESTTSGIAARYASSLFDLAKETKALDAVEKDLGRFDELMRGSADLMRLVRSPVFSTEDQLRAVNAILAKATIGGLVGNFISVVARNRRLFAMPAMLGEFRKLAAAHRGEVSADVTVAQALSAGQASQLAAALKESAGRNVTVNQVVDPSILGGMIVKIGSRQIDTSLRTKLSSLKLALKEVG